MRHTRIDTDRGTKIILEDPANIQEVKSKIKAAEALFGKHAIRVRIGGLWTALEGDTVHYTYRTEPVLTIGREYIRATADGQPVLLKPYKGVLQGDCMSRVIIEVYLPA